MTRWTWRPPSRAPAATLRFEHISGLHYAFKTLAYTMINLRHYCQI
jgi:hypothetical protein